MAFGWGFLGGLSESLDVNIKKSIEDSKKGVRRAADFHIRRREAAHDKYADQLEGAEEAISLFGSLTGGDLEQAAQLVRSAGGPQNSQAFFDQIKTAVGLGINIDDLLEDYTKVDGAPRTSRQLAGHFARLRPMLTPEGEDPTGWAKLFNVKGVKETVNEAMASRGFADQAPERMGTISPATVNYKLLYPEKAAAYNRVIGLTNLDKARENVSNAQAPQIKAETAKVNKQISLMDKNSIASINLMAAQAKSANATAGKTQQQLKMAREYDVRTYDLAIQKSQVDILRKIAGTEIEDHMTYLNAYNTELEDTMANQVHLGQQGSDAYKEADRKKHTNDAAITKYWDYMSAEQQATQQAKLNPISTFNTLFQQQLTMEGLKFKKGFADTLTEIMPGSNTDILKVNRAYSSAIKAFTAGFGQLSGPAAMMLKASLAGQETANANYVATKVREATTRGGGIGMAAAPIKLGQGKQKIPIHKLIVGQVYDMGPDWMKPKTAADGSVDKGYALPYAVWHGTGWIYSARNE